MQTMDSVNDNDLILQAQRGDMLAFEQLVQRHDRKVLSIAQSFSGNAADAQDIYQEVFLRVFRALPRFEFRSQFSTWLHRITTNVCLTQRAMKREHLSLDEPFESDGSEQRSWLDALAGDTATDRQTLDAEIVEHVRRAMRSLSPQQRLVFTLRHYHGYKLREIAEMIGCAEGTAKKYLFTATERMRDQLKDLFCSNEES